MSNNDLQYMDIKELANALKINRQTVYLYMQRGLIPYGVKIGKNRRWKVDDIRNALRQLEETQKGGEIA